MKRRFQLYDVVTVTQDLPAQGLVQGQVGTIVEQHDADAFEVEFVDNNGSTYALAALQGTQLMVLHYEPAPAA